ncbi:dUTPase [Bacillus coagulans]|uniref:dUTP diphosphatase n=1 Tax=Heyndrickxia coagulans TaxID=1398 RepID=UPI0013770133|nr:dUTP diphosphatase [Heyndrickxia coagulans]NCG67790.1 dUTPase [Heyndrickxia coagulans]
MNLQKLFEAQAELDKHIIEKKGLHGVNLLPNLILALQVELGECANEWRGFKHWSDDQEPRLKGYKEIKCKWCNGSGDDGTGMCPDCMSTGDVYKEYNPLLEEYVDCLHFTLSIGLHLYNENIATDLGGFRKTSIQDQFRTLFHYSTMLSGSYWNFFEYLIGLGEMLGFTWEQIEQAYFEKNEENHKRQENGY